MRLYLLTYLLKKTLNSDSELNSEQNHILEFVNECEEESIKRVSQDILRNASIEIETTEKPNVLSRRFNATEVTEHDERYTREIMQGFFQRKMKCDANIDLHISLSQLKNRHTFYSFVLASQFTSFR